jgi:hypothetical protein
MKLFSILFVMVLSVGLLSCSKDDDHKAEQEPTPEPSPDATYSVGPTRDFKTLQDIEDMLQPGDVVEIDGDQEYEGGIILSEDGTVANPIIIRGKKINGKLPIIREGGDRIIIMNGANTILEGLEIVGKSNETTKAGVGVYANNLTIRGCIIHDCRNGVLGYGEGTGNVTVEYCEIYECGGEPTGSFDFAHQIYMATDEAAFPNAVFRLQHTYIHDAKGGNNVKSRSGRNEIYYNWIEGARYHGLEMIGPDLEDNDNVTHGMKREDSDVVGNVLFGTSNGSAARVGGDGTGATGGRYRFVNNTFIIANNGDGLRGLDDIETVELHNNIFYKGSAAGADVFSEADVTWVDGRQVKGANNFIQTGFSKIPAGLSGTLTSASPDFTDAATFNFTLKGTSTLKNAGTTPQTFTGAAFPTPLYPPAFHPPNRVKVEVGEAVARPANGVIDIGAFEN